ncbi:YbjN domain-containing protein [bacterium]|nr:YbjN domain-containing protein [bacterium]
MADFQKVKDYLFELGYEIQNEFSEQEMVVISNKRMGINNLIIDCESPILVFEQFIFDIKEEKRQDANMYLKLLQMNRGLVHGAFVVNDDATKVIFRDTLQLENLDLNEIKGTIDSLSIAMVEYMDELIEFAK